jgi:hypothetical protein
MKKNTEILNSIFLVSVGLMALLMIYILADETEEQQRVYISPPLYVGYNPKCYPGLKLPETKGKSAIEKWLENQSCPANGPYRYAITMEDSFVTVTRLDPDDQQEKFVIPLQ